MLTCDWQSCLFRAMYSPPSQQTSKAALLDSRGWRNKAIPWLCWRLRACVLPLVSLSILFLGGSSKGLITSFQPATSSTPFFLRPPQYSIPLLDRDSYRTFMIWSYHVIPLRWVVFVLWTASVLRSIVVWRGTLVCSVCCGPRFSRRSRYTRCAIFGLCLL